MVEKQPTRVHLIAGGYPPGKHAGHDMDYARLRLLEKLGQDDSIHTTVGGDYTDTVSYTHLTLPTILLV